jgi:hypothetical protein
MSEMRGQLPRAPLQAAAAQVALLASEGGRTPEHRTADRRFTRNLLLTLLGVEIVNGITIVILDALVPGNAAEISPWVMFAVRLGISLMLYGLAYRGFRVAWWLTWARILVGTALFVLSLTDSFDFVSLVFTLVFLGFGSMLAFSPRVKGFRKDRREKREET